MRPAASGTVLHGRGHELDTIRTLLATARAGTGGVLVVEGEPGAGKSALLEAAAAEAVGFQVLRTRGIQSEAELAFTGLTELLAPLTEVADSLPPEQHRVLRTALDARGTATAPIGQLPLATAVLALLTAAARRRPVLALVDDAHWLDGASLAAVGFVARRLASAPIALLLVRRGPEPKIGAADAVEMRLRGLGAEAARGLLADLGVEARAGAGNLTDLSVEENRRDRLDEQHEHRASASSASSGSSASPGSSAARLRLAADEFDRLLTETRGNPLALIEMARLAVSGVLDLATLAGGREPLPSAVQLAGLYHDQVTTLPERARRALLTAAASFTGEATPIQAALFAARLDLGDLAPAEQAGHVELTDGTVRFAHPLLRSAVYHGAADADVRDAHDRLADAFATEAGPAAREQRAWHRSYASDGPDAPAAAALAEVAAAAARRGAPAAARQAYQRAAVIAPDPTPYLIKAAVCARVEGDAEAALDLLDAAEAALENQTSYIEEEVLRAGIRSERSRVDLSRADPARLMTELAAAAEIVPDPAHAADLTVAAAAAAVLGAHYGQAQSLAALAVERAVTPSACAAAHAVAEHLALLLGEPASDTEHELPDPADLDTPLEAIVYPAWTAALRGLPHPRLGQALKAAHGAGARSRLPALLTMAAELDQRAGHWDVARGRALAAADIGADLGQPLWPALALGVAARIAAYRGDRADFADLENRLAALPPVPADHPAELAFRHAKAVLALDEDREAATTELQAIEGVLHTQGVSHPAFIPVRADLDELLNREPVGEQSDQGSSELAGTTDLADPFRAARRDLQAARRLRDRRHHAEARALLEPARDTFRRLRARRWEALCDEELTHLVAAKSPEPNGLTPYETQVARHVGAGRTNNETAAALYISPKTVEYHLRNLYKKLGIRSRTELARIVATWEGDPKQAPR
jgi:DNA-binding CsgD family transcriptional regulator